MRLATVRVDGRQRTAVVTGKGDDGKGDDLSVAVLPERCGALPEVVRGGPAALREIDRVAARAERRPLPDVTLLAPLPRFNRDILCIGWNYEAHFSEGSARRGGNGPARLPEHPTFFTKAPGTVVGPFDPIAYDPALSLEWDYEAELAVIIGRDGRSIPESRAMDHVFGYCVANDISLRDVQRAHGGQWMKGKSIDRTMPFGPWVTTADEIDDLYDLSVRCEVNAVRLQDGNTSQMLYPVATIIAELSRGMTLHAGDVVLTGTPDGVGNARTPPVFLKAGDVVVTTVSRLGELRNTVEQTALT